MCDWIDDLNQNMSEIEHIARNSEVMIMWYGTDFDDLDTIGSYTDLIEYIRKESNTQNTELYLLYKAQ